MVIEKRKKLYNTVLSQTFSSCGNFLFAGNNFGDVFVYSIPDIAEVPSDEEIISKTAPSLEPIQVFSVIDSGHIESLAFHKNFLIVGLPGELRGYQWCNESKRIKKQLWEVRVPTGSESMEAVDVNALWLNDENDEIYLGCGDSKILGLNLDNGQFFRTFTGHKDYIHCLQGLDNRLYSASEDGSIKFWDVRQKKSTGLVEPYKNHELFRPQMGKWLGSVACSENFFVCGGGPKASLWHTRTNECTTVFPFSGALHVSGFIDDTVLLAGQSSNVVQYSLNGDLSAEIPVSSPATYSVIWQTTPTKLMSIAGAQNEIDICLNFNYKDIVLKLYAKDASE
ncbi:THO complex subunit 6 [Phlebotomus argentipes]|uniref:THO complex subunit 6 n=1 Tax=Phlebotomus argentipes TaxID=94469 RepID=UPI0028936900|nr:THO complex subunit 6 [Phlebotomus argentipes]